MKPFLYLSVCAACTALGHVAMAADGDIIVTATRNAQPAKNIAGSVSALGSAQLYSSSPAHPAELLNEVAGVNIHRGSGQEHLTAIRSPVLTGGAGAGSFLYLEDGVALRAAGFANVNGLFESMFEMAARVEITKGPGSVLYGNNAVHGLINIVSQAPSDSRDFTLDMLGNTGGYARLKTTFNGSVFSGNYHVSANIAHDPGFRANSGFDQQKLHIRHDRSIGRWDVKTAASFQNLNQETAGFIRGVDAYKDRVISASNPNPEAFRDGKSARIAVHMNTELSSQAKLSLIPYARWTELEFLRHFVPGKALENSGHKSIGLLSNYTNDRYTLGFDIEYTDGFVNEFQAGPSVFSFIQGEHFDYDVKALVLSPYAQTHITLGPQTRLNIGARADYTHYDYDNKINSGKFGRFIRSDDRQDDFFTLSPKLSIIHTLSPNITLYSRLARGSRAPQISDTYSLQINQTIGEIKAETLDSLEFGMKGNMGALNLEAAVFAMRKDNFFFRNANGFNVVNGKTKHVGIELNFAAPLSQALDISGGLTLANHTYSFTDIVRSASSSITDGDQVDTAPNTLGFMQVSARPTKRTELSLKWQHMGEYFTDPGNTTTYPGHNIFTLHGQYKISEQTNIYARIDNLFNARYANRADFAFGSERYFPARPRTLFVGIRFRE